MEEIMSEKTVLIIDDEPDTRVYFSSILEDNGYKTIPAETGAEGIKKLNEQIPDLITLDVSMPEMSGVKFYRTIRENDAWKSIPIIIITGVSDDFKNFISSRSKVPPPEGYLSKPVEADDLLAFVGELLL
jgi:CheY-like chemotaxis protein